MIDKLQTLDVPAALFHWVLNVLTNRPRCVREGDTKPQGCVLSPWF